MYAWKSNPHGLGADRYPNQDRYPVPVTGAAMSAMVVAENWEDRVCWVFRFAFRP